MAVGDVGLDRQDAHEALPIIAGFVRAGTRPCLPRGPATAKWLAQRAAEPSMDFDALSKPALAFVEANAAWTPLIAGLLAFGESLAFISLLVPATVILVGIGALIGASDIAFWPVVAGAALGAALGDWVSYEFGRHYGARAKTFWPMRRYPEATQRAEIFLARWGSAAVAIGRFFGPIRAVIPLVAGMFGLARLPFQLANFSSAIVWAFVLLAPGAGLISWFQS